MAKQFPADFLWGAASSAHQIEGGLDNNWTEWEKSPGRIKSLEAQGKNPALFISGQACNSYRLMPADIDCLKQLNCNAYRFSLEWSRIEPQANFFNISALNHYREFIKMLRGQGVEPFVTLWHWTFPRWLWRKQGFLPESNVKYFSRFTKRVVEALGYDVKYWLTINEPNVYSDNSYLYGIWPPQIKDHGARNRVLHNLIQAHQQAYSIIKQINPQNQVGLAKNNSFFEIKKFGLRNFLVKQRVDRQHNHYFLNKVKKHLDFIGLNYYFHNLIDRGLNKNKNEQVSDMGWELFPQGLYNVLLDLKKYGLPIYVTESGLADEKDRSRGWYIAETVQAMHQALESGVDLRGYFHWSLMDNFEWADGYAPKFGLFSVNSQTFVRQARASAGFYSRICKNNGTIPIDTSR